MKTFGRVSNALYRTGLANRLLFFDFHKGHPDDGRNSVDSIWHDDFGSIRYGKTDGTEIAK